MLLSECEEVVCVCCSGGGGGGVCVCVGGGGVPSISFFLLHMLFSLRIYRVYPGALMRHFIGYAILRGLVVLPLYVTRGEALC